MFLFTTCEREKSCSLPVDDKLNTTKQAELSIYFIPLTSAVYPELTWKLGVATRLLDQHPVSIRDITRDVVVATC